MEFSILPVMRKGGQLVPLAKELGVDKKTLWRKMSRLFSGQIEKVNGYLVLTDEQISILRQDCEQTKGMHIRDLADELFVEPDLLYNWVKQAKMEVKRTRYGITLTEEQMTYLRRILVQRRREGRKRVRKGSLLH